MTLLFADIFDNKPPVYILHCLFRSESKAHARTHALAHKTEPPAFIARFSRRGSSSGKYNRTRKVDFICYFLLFS